MPANKKKIRTGHPYVLRFLTEVIQTIPLKFLGHKNLNEYESTWIWL